MSEAPVPEEPGTPVPHRRRPRYSGKNPRRFEDKYKEHDPSRFPETVAKVLASGKTPAGAHRSIMVGEILEVLAPQPGETAADCTLGYGGHTLELLRRLIPGGRLLGLDVDPLELPKTEERLRVQGFGPEVFTAHRSNYAGLLGILGQTGVGPVHMVLADLGVSSMQLDDPARGFSVKGEGPLDMRMNPQRGQPASALLRKLDAPSLQTLLVENSDEPHAERLASVLAGQDFPTTTSLREVILATLAGRVAAEEQQAAVRRVFQALRIAVNDEFAALDAFLRQLPQCLAPGGRVAILTFHSGEDRRVKKSFQEGFRTGVYVEVAEEVRRASAEERRANPRSTSAKLRWARRA